MHTICHFDRFYKLTKFALQSRKREPPIDTKFWPAAHFYRNSSKMDEDDTSSSDLGSNQVWHTFRLHKKTFAKIMGTSNCSLKLMHRWLTVWHQYLSLISDTAPSGRMFFFFLTQSDFFSWNCEPQNWSVSNYDGLICSWMLRKGIWMWFSTFLQYFLCRAFFQLYFSNSDSLPSRWTRHEGPLWARTVSLKTWLLRYFFFLLTMILQWFA